MWLIGMMGSGQSTVDRLAGERLGVAFHGTDHMVENSAGTSITEIWRARGEVALWDLATAALESVPEGGIAAAGGESTLWPILSKRAPLYESVSTHQVETTRRSLEEVVSEVIGTWPG